MSKVKPAYTPGDGCPRCGSHNTMHYSWCDIHNEKYRIVEK